MQGKCTIGKVTVQPLPAEIQGRRLICILTYDREPDPLHATTEYIGELVDGTADDLRALFAGDSTPTTKRRRQ